MFPSFRGFASNEGSPNPAVVQSSLNYVLYRTRDGICESHAKDKQIRRGERLE